MFLLASMNRELSPTRTAVSKPMLLDNEMIVTFSKDAFAVHVLFETVGEQLFGGSKIFCGSRQERLTSA